MIAHVNHSLRAESDADEALVRSFAAERSLPLEVRKADTKQIAKKQKKGIEETARNIRYAFFRDVAATHGITHVATAHTANDQAETVIMHAVRGAGVRGLAGIPKKRNLPPPPLARGGGRGVVILRPWLHIARHEIESYIADQNLDVARDQSNADLNFQRNRIRHSVIPALEAAYPDRSPIEALAKLAGRMSKLQKFLTALTNEKLEASMLASGAIPLLLLKNLHGQMLHALLEAWINKIAGHYRLTELETRKVEKFLALNARQVELRNGIVLTRRNEPGAGQVIDVVTKSLGL
jgi:tRNA(Ile)-lysidine synthase